MEVFTEAGSMRAWSDAARAAGDTIAAVPTMGALHAGHQALIAAAAERADRVVVTIFVNPLQFNQPTDFDAYPRAVEADIDTCRACGVDAVYAPTAATMYPPGFDTHVEPGALSERLEGAMRPGHFRGVVTVVTKLLAATRPDLAVFGEKDYQQLAIVRRLASDLDLGVTIVGLPTVREPDGLALSSRNQRLDAPDRAAAVVISAALTAVAEAHAEGRTDADRLRRFATEQIGAEPRATLEYVEIVDPDTLDPVSSTSAGAVVLAAAWFGGVRLIDNRILPPARSEGERIGEPDHQESNGRGG